ncbi:hypothetical protein ACWKSP_32370 [Micromonosporaceae bacterium Da 78-11]
MKSREAEPGPATAGVLGRAARRLLPPKQLGRRIQWLFLLMGLFNVVGALPRTFGVPGLSGVERGATVLAAAFLVVWWIRGYRTLKMPAWALPAEALAIAAIATGLRRHARDALQCHVVPRPVRHVAACRRVRRGRTPAR